MNIQPKITITLIMVIALSNQAFAKNKQSDENKPPRPDFSTIDTNKDGDIDLDEFSSLRLPFGDHQTVFDSIDTDNNGIISNEEFKNHKPPRPPRK